MLRRLFSTLCCALWLSACSSPTAGPDPLYNELGGEAGLTRIVEGMLLNVARDPRIAERFRDANIERVRDKLVEQFCQIAGGPCTYTGDSMPEVHRGLDISPSEFNALVEDLIKAMDSEGIAVPVQNRLIARLAKLRGQVIHQ